LRLIQTSADDRAHYLAGNGSGDGTHLIGEESQGVMACGASGS
jgi:hypothetical protein